MPTRYSESNAVFFKSKEEMLPDYREHLFFCGTGLLVLFVLNILLVF